MWERWSVCRGTTTTSIKSDGVLGGQVVMRRADSDMKTLEDSDAAGLGQRARQAAYSCACALVVASQQKEQFFKVLLEKPGADNGPPRFCFSSNYKLLLRTSSSQTSRISRSTTHTYALSDLKQSGICCAVNWP